MGWLIGILIRLVIPLSILRFPFYGSLLSSLADTVDVVIWNALHVQNLSENYNLLDKLLDNYFYLIQGYTMLSWKNAIAKKTGFALLIYRSIGLVIYEITKIRTMLFIFPNIFILFFISYLGYKLYLKKDPIKSTKSSLIFVLILAVPKLIQEYFFHVKEVNIFRWLMSLVG